MNVSMNRSTRTPARQHPDNRRKAVARADRIDQHAHLDAPLDGSRQSLGKLPSAVVVVEDVAHHAHPARCAVDGGKHRGKGGVAPVQGLVFQLPESTVRLAGRQAAPNCASEACNHRARDRTPRACKHGPRGAARPAIVRSATAPPGDESG